MLLDEVDAQYSDLIFHCDVRWLSRGKVLDRFLALLPEIKQFLTEEQQNFPDLSDTEWQQDLGFMSDITSHLNKLNLKLQGSHFVTDLYSAINAFRTELNTFPINDCNGKA